MNEEELRRLAELAAIKSAEAFRLWKIEAERPEQDLKIQAVSDAWDLLTFRNEQYVKAIEDLRVVVPNALLCDDCPDTHEHSKRVTDA